jgi:hypothetical protein
MEFFNGREFRITLFTIVLTFKAGKITRFTLTVYERKSWVTEG